MKRSNFVYVLVRLCTVYALHVLVQYNTVCYVYVDFMSHPFTCRKSVPFHCYRGGLDLQ